MISAILRDLRHELEAAVAERARLWALIEPHWQPYCDASKREVLARAAQHRAVVSAVRDEDDSPDAKEGRNNADA